jgi:hypothetical protein
MWLWAACLYGVLLLLSPFIALMTNARQFSPVGGIASVGPLNSHHRLQNIQIHVFTDI